MSKVIILGSRQFGEKNNPTVIAEKLRQQLPQSSVDVVFWEELLFRIARDEQQITDQASKLDLKDADMVIALNWYRSGTEAVYRDVALAVGLYLVHHQVEFWNHEMVIQRSTTKLSAMMQLALHGYDVPITYFSLKGDYLRDTSLEYPLILKDVAASRGRNNYLVKSADEHATKLAAQPFLNRLMAQEYIRNSGDLRIVCVNDTPRVVIQRVRADERTHLNNTSQGGSATLGRVEDLPPKLVSACRDICKFMGRGIAGVDLLIANDGSSRQVFLEINALPQLTTGVYVEEKLAAIAEALRQKGLE